MFKNILNTFFTKIFTAILSLVIVVINSKVLGASGVGIISLIILSVAIYLLIHEFFSGAFVYFVPRNNNFQLLLIAYLGVFITILPFSILYYIVPLAPLKYFFYVMALSVIFAFSNINQLILLGHEDIKNRNLINLFQSVTVFLLLLYFFFVEKKITVYSYIYSLFAASLFGMIMGLIKTKKYIIIYSFSGISILFFKVIRLGAYNALSNLIQKINYRLSYYFIEHLLGTAALGKFSVAVKLSESTWLAGQSIASVQYARISNVKDDKKAVELTLVLFKITFLISLVSIAFFAVLPDSFYRLVFGVEFSGVNEIIWVLAPGIVALSSNMILSHYFSGMGLYKINTYASAIGLIFIVFFALVLIPAFHLLGAGIAMSFSYIASMAYSVFRFIKYSESSFSDLLIKPNDFIVFKYFLKQKLLRNF
ncbi:MAG: polysaccharide biosynthesis C-terminal domain-containing protein [Bacteroidales bacterium]|nr:polysaccharide biosynthesis C-terminal domain-containing protein [Bacteroidales bacterium]